MRLVILKHAKYDMDQYLKEASLFVDIVELEHHSAFQCSIEAIDFTQNSMKYVIKVAKQDSFQLSFPLNYMVHSSLVKLYFGEPNANTKSLLIPDFKETFA